MIPVGSGTKPKHLAIDIHASHRLEAGSRPDQAHWREFAENLPQLSWSCDADGLCDHLSLQWVSQTGKTEVEQLGHRWLEQVEPEERGGLMARWNESVLRGSCFEAAFRLKSAKGVCRWFKAQGVPRFAQDGQVAHWFK